MSVQSFAEAWPEPGALGPRQVFPQGVVLFRQGASPEMLYLVHEGFIKLTRGEGTGRGLVIGLRSPGWLLGASSALLGRQHPASAETVTSSLLSPIPPADFVQVVEQNARAALWVARLQSRELYDQTVLVGEIGALRPRQRLEHFLARILAQSGHNEQGQGVRLHLPLKQHEVAQAISVTPSHLSRLYSQLEAENAIRRQKGWIVVPRASALFRVAMDLVQGG